MKKQFFYAAFVKHGIYFDQKSEKPLFQNFELFL